MDFLLQAQDQLIPAHSKYISRIISIYDGIGNRNCFLITNYECSLMHI